MTCPVHVNGIVYSIVNLWYYPEFSRAYIVDFYLCIVLFLVCGTIISLCDIVIDVSSTDQWNCCAPI